MIWSDQLGDQLSPTHTLNSAIFMSHVLHAMAVNKIAGSSLSSRTADIRGDAEAHARPPTVTERRSFVACCR